jgi:hypothetical protein
MKRNDFDMFFEVFHDIPFPLFCADLARLRAALAQPHKAGFTSDFVARIDVPTRKRAAFVSGLRGVLRNIDVPMPIAGLFAKSATIEQVGLSKQLLAMAAAKPRFGIVEVADNLVWEEESLWPVAYSSCLEQFLSLIYLHKALLEERIKQSSKHLESAGYAPENLQTLSEYPRQLPTRFHYAAASLGAWLGGAINVQYFACYAAIRQITHSSLNLKYAERIGYDPNTAAKLDASGIIALPVSLVLPLFEAQGNGTVFGSICLDESNPANDAAASFFDTKDIESSERLPGFVADKYYRAPFYARRLEKYGFYGTKDVLRDHYEKFYANLKPVSLIRCKHYCVPVIEVQSMEELRSHASKIPVHDQGGVFFRGQECLYILQRDPTVQQLLFADSCHTEPSLTTSASREKGYDYEVLHFALRFFLEQDVLKRAGGGEKALVEQWRKQSVCPDCKLDAAILALAQHYGLPSHGLDVTDSDDVALWFATNRYGRGQDGQCSSYRKLRADDWPGDPTKWPVIIACQCVTHSIQQSLHDCHELTPFGFEAKRPLVQKARFFQGGHSDHQNRLAEAVVCVFRLAPGAYDTKSTFESLFPSPNDDPAYRVMLEFASSPDFGPVWGRYVNRFHK